MSFVVLFNGHAASGKTTLAYAIAPALKAGLVSTSALGPFVARRADPGFQRMRERRYGRALELADKHMELGTPVILDGTYALRRWRQDVFRRVCARDVRDVVVVTCECHDEKALARRFAQRATNPDLPDARANSMDAYLGSATENEAFDADAEAAAGIVFGHVHVDTARGTVKLVRPSEAATRVARYLRQHMREDGRRFLVAFEGIGGSGKTTQSVFLRDRLGQDGAGKVALCGEFSQGPLGRWIASSPEGGLRVLPSFGSTLSVHAVLMVDWLSQMRKDARAEWMILDRGWMSHAAHMRAIPQSGGSLPPAAWGDFLAQTRNLLRSHQEDAAGAGFTVFLDCPVGVAIDRVKARGGALAPGDGIFLESLSAAYREIAAAEPGIVRIDATRPPGEISMEIHARLREAWGDAA